MHLDLQTLSVITVFIVALLGALLLFAGAQSRRGISAPLWWGGGFVAAAGGLALRASHGVIDEFPAVDCADALMLLAAALLWTGARAFEQRPIRPLLLPFVPAFWLLLWRLPILPSHGGLRVATLSLALAALLFLSAREIWRGRDEPLLSRWPSIVVLAGYAAALVGRAAATPLSGAATSGSLSFALVFGMLLFGVVMAFLQLNMTKERMELKHKVSSRLDPLSGVANRRAFLDGAARLLANRQADDEPLAMLLFDLDHLKDINDRRGHAIGDAVLQEFAGTAAATLGSEALLARIGGEEFAATIAVGDLDEAYAIAERVRRNFAAAAAHLGGDGLTPSVSVGVALGSEAEAKVPDLLAIVDRALGRAKLMGRNRVETELPEDRHTVSGAPSSVPIIDHGGVGARSRPSRRRWRAAL